MKLPVTAEGRSGSSAVPVSNDATPVRASAPVEGAGLSERPDSQSRSFSRPSRFCETLEQLGGLYAAFGRFLLWRSDILRSEALLQLNKTRLRVAPIPASAAAQRLKSYGGPVAALAGPMQPDPCWSTISRCAFRTEHDGMPVVAEFAREPFPEAAFRELEKKLSVVQEPAFRPAITPEVFAQFRAWMQLSSSLGRERSYLESLRQVPTLVAYPKIMEELCREDVLVFEWVEGDPVSTGITRGNAEDVRQLGECVLEQICIIGAVDGDLDLESMVRTPEGRLAVRNIDRFVPIPAALASSCHKYVSAVLSSDAPGAAHLLVKLSHGRTALHFETKLLDELSNLEPELKVNVQFPASAGVFESNWRAIQRSGLPKPLFLDVLHRNLVAVGYWNSELARPDEGRVPDLLAEAQWPVLSRLLRTRINDLFTREVASEWFIGAGLLAFEGIRQANRLLDQVRQNEVAVGVDIQTPPADQRMYRRAVRSRVGLGMLLIGFLVSLRFASIAGEPWSAVWAVLAASAAVGLFWMVARLE